ncbi:MULTISPECIES: HAD hydrolase-like protein [unclassified Pseudodesulfovibrio]|uniref:HAD family hydrolase n=1 Tax=unclassified Pseudodesulfovibrio TaxID=2661612 RepID=UPI000FEB5E52|nr:MULTISPECIES: HAD hydrolase-like protein [unclassified Pseudodesulfovibrio]MCJ2163701.1 HAD family hydrolase [Pseudodesulfovibrio sp. S3-i]RWU06044.1 HAD family hydrolase [Pseudodesulfovibrio sp. S3]
MALANPIMNPRLLEGLKTIVFDNDGVLIDSYEANMRYYGAIKEQLGLPPMTDAEKVFVHTRTHNEAVRHIVSADQVDRAFEIIGGFDSASLQQYLKRSIGIREFLCWLRGMGFGLAVNTSRGQSMDMILEMMDLEGFFHPVITSCKVSLPKPHPEGLYRIMHEHGVRPHEVAYIGDSIVDQKAAQAAGVRFWAYRDSRLSAEVHIENFWDIRAAMQRCYKGNSLTY